MERRLAVARLRELRERWQAAGVKAKEIYEESRRLLEERQVQGQGCTVTVQPGEDQRLDHRGQRNQGRLLQRV